MTQNYTYPEHIPKHRQSLGRPRIDPELEELVLRMARENRSWGYDRIQGTLKHLGYSISDQTVGNILKSAMVSHPLPSARKPPHGKSLFAHTWTCWWPRISSRPRCGPGVG